LRTARRQRGTAQGGRIRTTQNPAELQFSLTGIQDEHGNWINVGTNMISEKGPTNREVAMIGGGAIDRRHYR
jgi:hypothetical protein